MNWLEILREACTKSSQAQVAKKIEYSSATLSLVLKGEYKGNIENVQQAVEKHLMRVTVICPILGEITKIICEKQRNKPFSSASRQSVELFKACKECINAS